MQQMLFGVERSIVTPNKARPAKVTEKRKLTLSRFYAIIVSRGN